MTESIGRFPAIERDLAVLLPIEVPASKAVDTMRRVGGPFLHDVLIFDLFTGEGVAQGFKSMAFRLTFRSDEGTLIDEQINPVMEEIIEQLEDKTGSQITLNWRLIYEFLDLSENIVEYHSKDTGQSGYDPTVLKEGIRPSFLTLPSITIIVS